jgi:hypothetical protein
MNPRLARWISIFLHPVWMPLYALFILFQLNPYLLVTVSPQLQWTIFAIVVLDTIVIPLFITYMLFSKGWVRTLDMEEREERIIPYITNALCLLLAYYMMKKLQAPNLVCLMMLGAVAAVVVAVIVNLRWKISIHMIGLGGLTGLFFGLSTVLLVDLNLSILLSILTAGLLGTARLSLGAHHPAQIYAGFFVGFLCEFVMLSV